MHTESGSEASAQLVLRTVVGQLVHLRDKFKPPEFLRPADLHLMHLNPERGLMKQGFWGDGLYVLVFFFYCSRVLSLD